MNIKEEIRSGYAWSFAAPLFITFLMATWFFLVTLFTEGILDALGAFFMTVMLFGVVSIFISAIFCAAIGIPLYMVLRYLKLANPVIITVIGGVSAYLIMSGDMPFITVTYGCCSAFFFWLGSYQIVKSSNKQKQADA